MEDDRHVVVKQGDSGANTSMIALLIAIGVIVVGGLLFWHPWTTSSTTNTTTVTQPQNGNGSTTTKSDSNTTTNSQPQPQST